MQLESDVVSGAVHAAVGDDRQDSGLKLDCRDGRVYDDRVGEFGTGANRRLRYLSAWVISE